MRREIVGGRVDQVTDEENRIADAGNCGPIDTVRDDKPRPLSLRLAVTVEAIARERKGERGELRLIDARRQAVGAGRQGGRKLADEKRPALCGIDAAEAEEHALQIAVRVGDQRPSAGLGLEARGRREPALALVERTECRVEVLALHQMHGDGVRAT